MASGGGLLLGVGDDPAVAEADARDQLTETAAVKGFGCRRAVLLARVRIAGVR